MQNSYHECLGGGYDALMALWYPPVSHAMADLAVLRGDGATEARYRDLESRARDAFNKTFWHEVTENGHTFRRFFGSRDWDGVIHDFGFTYYNLEAADFATPSKAQALDILWWLDTGYWKGNPEEPWQEDIYGIWRISPPFNTVEIDGWIGITGTLPYREVLTNGGTRLMYGARDLTVRARYLSIDNMHERNQQVLARFASPDRLTGGRVVDEPGGRGRWHFGPPQIDRADIEGFREIFPGNGTLGEAQVAAYLGAELRPDGLALFPRVPSALNRLALRGMGYHGGVFDFEIEARRETVRVAPGETAPGAWGFTPAAPFSKVGVRAHYDDTGIPFKSGARVALVLERQDGGHWTPVARNWMCHVRDGDWVWVNAETVLDARVPYRLRVQEMTGPAGRPVTVDCGGAAAPTVLYETRRLTVRTVYCPAGSVPALRVDDALVSVRPEGRVTLPPGQRLQLDLSGGGDTAPGGVTAP